MVQARRGITRVTDAAEAAPTGPPPPRELLESAADEIAQQAGIDPALFRRLITQESGWNTHALGPITKSGERAAGLGQLMPGTAKDLKVKDRFNALENLRGTAAYYRQQLDAFGGDQLRALAAYNFGPGNVKQGEIAPPETRNYVKIVLADSPMTWPPPPAPAEASAAPPPEAAAPPEAAPPPSAETAPPDTAAASVLPNVGGLVRHGFQGALSGSAQLADLALKLNLPLAFVKQRLTGTAELPQIAPHVQGVFAGPATTSPEKFAEATGAGALFGPAGVASSLASEAAGQVAQKLGLPETPMRIVGGIIPGARGLYSAVKGGMQAIRGEAAAAKTAAEAEAVAAKTGARTDLSAATTAAEAQATAVRDAATAAEAEVKAAALRTRYAAQDAFDEAKTLHGSAVTEAQETAVRTIVQAEAQAAEHVAATARAATAAQAALGNAEALAKQQMDALLMSQDDLGRGLVLANVMHGEQDAWINIVRRPEWESLKATWGRTPVPTAGLQGAAETVLDHMQRAGVAPDAAKASAARILDILAPEVEGTRVPVDSIPLNQALDLVQDLGSIFGRATGSTESRAGQLYGTLKQSINDALTPAGQKAWTAAKDATIHEIATFRNQFAKQALQDTTQGQATADLYVENLMKNGSAADSLTTLRELRRAVGTNTTGHKVLADAVVRRPYLAATDKLGKTNWAQFAATLRNRYGLKPAFDMVVTDPRDQAAILGIADEVIAAQRTAEREGARLAPVPARAEAIVRSAKAERDALVAAVTKRGEAWVSAQRTASKAARREAAATVVESRTAKGAAIRAADTAKASAIAASKTRSAAAIAAAEQRLATAEARLKAVTASKSQKWNVLRVSRSAFEDILAFALAGVPGTIAMHGGRSVGQWVRDSANRTVLREAMRTPALSSRGRQLALGIMLGARRRDQPPAQVQATP